MKNILKKIFVSSLLVLSVNAYSETQVMNGVDDGTVHVSLGHSFPYYGGVFTDAWMSSNGFIILYDPTTGYGNSNTGQSWCQSCGWGYSGGPPDGKSNLSYMIAPLWSDFRHITSVANSGYFYETDTGGTWFEWRNVREYGTSNLNTFGLQLYPEGSFDFHYSQVNVTRHNSWIGFSGDATSQSGSVYNEVNELFYKQNSMTTNDVTNFTDATTNFGYAWWGQDGGYESTGPDCSNPLNDPSCTGYDEAYFEQQCSNDALYDTQCSGYAEAFLTQQCSSDALYDTQCDGYEVAWLDDQCNTDPLFSQSCSGYSAALIQQEQQEAMNSTGYMQEDFNGGSDGSMDSQSDGTGGPGGPGGSDGSGGEPDSFSGDTSGGDPLFQESQPYEEETQFTQTQDNFSEPPSFENPETFSEPMIEREISSDPVEVNEPQRFSEPEPVAQIEEEPFVEEEPFEEPPVRIEEREPMGEEPIEAIAEAELLVEPPVDEVLIEEAAVVDPAPVKELAVSKQTNIQIAMSVLETEKASASKRLAQSVNDSQSGSQDSTDQSSGGETSQQTQSSGDQSAITYGVQDSAVAELYGDSGSSVSYGDSDQMQQSSGMFETSDIENVADAVQISSVTTVNDTQQQDDTSVDFEQETFSTTDAMFDTQVSEAFSTGANISVVLSGARPDFSKFDVKPPTKQQQVATKKVESLAEKMSESAIQQNIEQIQENVQDSGGFEDQTVAVVLINYVPGFEQYSSQSLKSQNDWYRSKSIYKSNGNVDNTMTLYMMAGQTEQKHKQMVLEQYGR